MKSIKFVSIFLVAFVSGFAFSAPVSPSPTPVPPPDSLPVANKAMLRAYALEQVAGSNLGIWGESIMQSSDSVTNIYFHPETAPLVDEAIQKLSFTNLHFRVTDKTKPLSVWGSLHNSEGMSLFYGYTGASVSTQGAIVCPGGLTMKMESYIPIYVGPNVASAEIRGNGWTNINVWNGYMFFPADYTENDGTLILEYNDESGYQQIPYSLRTGDQIPLTSVSGTVGTTLSDYYSFTSKSTDTGILYVNLPGFVGEGHEAPVACIQVVGTSRTVKFSCVIYNLDNTVAEYPAHGWIFEKNSDSEIGVLLPKGAWSDTMTLTPGTYYFYPETELFETEPPIYVGGKGG